MGGVGVCKKEPDETEQDILLFEKVKKCMLQICDAHSDSIEYQLFKAKLEKASSFEDLSQSS